MALHLDDAAAGDGDGGENCRGKFSGAVVVLFEVTAKVVDVVSGGERHDAAAEAGAGNLGAENAVGSDGNVDHLVDLVGAASILARLPPQLRLFYSFGVVAFQVFDQLPDIGVVDFLLEGLFLALLVEDGYAVAVVGGVHQSPELADVAGFDTVHTAMRPSAFRQREQNYPADGIPFFGFRVVFQQRLELGDFFWRQRSREFRPIDFLGKLEQNLVDGA